MHILIEYVNIFKPGSSYKYCICIMFDGGYFCMACFFRSFSVSRCIPRMFRCKYCSARCSWSMPHGFNINIDPSYKRMAACFMY